LAIDVADPRLATGVDDFVAHLHGVVAAGERVAAADGDAVRAGPLERHFDAVGAFGKRVVALRTDGYEARFVARRRASAADPAALRLEEVHRVGREQAHRITAGFGRLRIAQQVGLSN